MTDSVLSRGNTIAGSLGHVETGSVGDVRSKVERFDQSGSSAQWAPCAEILCTAGTSGRRGDGQSSRAFASSADNISFYHTEDSGQSFSCSLLHARYSLPERSQLIFRITLNRGVRAKPRLRR